MIGVTMWYSSVNEKPKVGIIVTIWDTLRVDVPSNPVQDFFVDQQKHELSSHPLDSSILYSTRLYELYGR